MERSNAPPQSFARLRVESARNIPQRVAVALELFELFRLSCCSLYAVFAVCEVEAKKRLPRSILSVEGVGEFETPRGCFLVVCIDVRQPVDLLYKWREKSFQRFSCVLCVCHCFNMYNIKALAGLCVWCVPLCVW